MLTFGTDRVRQGQGEQRILFCRLPKDWHPRAPKTATTAEYPGTAVLWDERFFEVISAESAPAGGVRYVLEPWSDHHVIRVSERYDAPSEAHRESEHRAASAREKGRKAANIGGVFTGLLPAIVQEQLGSELGILPARLTSLSLVLPFLYLVWVGNDFARRALDPNAPPMPIPLLALAIYLFLECVIRLNIAWFHQRPIGSALGWFPYLLYYLAAGKRSGAVSPFQERRGEKLFFTEPTEDIALRDAYSMRELLLTLLSVGEQEALAARFGFEYRKHGFLVAWILLVVSLAGVVSSLASLQHGPRFSAILSLLVGLAIGGEQALRLPALRRGPAPSMLAVLIRPFTRKLLR